MSGLNFLLWTVAAVIILGVVVFIGASVYAYRKRKEMLDEYRKEHPSFMDRLKEAQSQQQELLRKQNKQ